MIKRIPWLALLLLFTTNLTLGWFLSALHEHWSAWIVVSLGILLVGAMVSCSWLTIRNSFAYLLASDFKVFLAAVFVAFLGVVIVYWLHTFAHLLVIICAFLLAKVDMQAASFRDGQVFRTISFVALLGLFSGGIANYLVFTLFLK